MPIRICLRDACPWVFAQKRRPVPYQPIEHYGIIGNLRTAALVGLDGSIDWLCLPRFEAPSVFTALVDDARRGWFCIAPASDYVRHKQV
jgi:GH15 family glucan-1,4-alpha-glucosidase